MKYYGQAAQDYFVLKVLKFKTQGIFIEIGSNDPIFINNTYQLETKYDWKGIMIEMDPTFLKSYKMNRPNSYHYINDATKFNYKIKFKISKKY